MNTSDYGTEPEEKVSICFQDPSITGLFADLLESHGIDPTIIASVAQAGQQTKIITEVQYFPLLTPEQAKRCLVVGRKSAVRGIPALCLTQPLTEDGVEEAIRKFLSL